MTSTPVAFGNIDVLRRIADDQPIPGHDAFAAEFGRDPSNFRRTLKTLESEGVITRPAGERPALTDLGRRVLSAMDVVEGSATAGDAPSARWPIDKIRPNPANRSIDDGAIDDLADSILGIGDIIQPLTLTPPDANGVRMILAGERRWRAVRRIMDRDAEAHNEEVLNGGVVLLAPSLPSVLEDGLPFVEREADEGEALLITVVENSQREDLTPWDDAQLLLKLAEVTGWSGAEVASRTGRQSETRPNGAKDVQDKLKIARQATPEQIEEYRRTGSWDALRNAALGRRPADPDQRTMLPAEPPTYPLQLFLVEAALRGERSDAGVWDADLALATGQQMPAAWGDDWFSYAPLSGHFRLTARATDWLAAIGLGDDADGTYARIARLAGREPVGPFELWNSVWLHDVGDAEPQADEGAEPAPSKASDFGVPADWRAHGRDITPDEGHARARSWLDMTTLERFVLPLRPGARDFGYPRAQIEIGQIKGGSGWIEQSGYCTGDIGHMARLEGVYSGDSPAWPTRQAALIAAAERIRSSCGGNTRGGLPKDIAEWIDCVLTGEADHAGDDPLVVNGVRFPNATRAAEARRAAGIDPTPSANYAARQNDDAPAADAEGDALTPAQRLALVELSIKVKRAPVAVIQGKPNLTTLDGLTSQAWLAYGARIGGYWLDPVANDLVRLGLIRIHHLPDHGAPIAVLTHDGLDRLNALDHNVPPNMLDQGVALRAATGSLAPADDRTYATDWLEHEVAPAATPDATTDESDAAEPAESLDHWSRDDADVQADKDLLDRVRTFFDVRDEIDEDHARALFAELNVSGPFTEDGDAGIVAVVDGDPASLAFVDVDRQLPPERARALAFMAAWAMEVVFGSPAPTDQPAVQAPDHPAVPIRKSITPDFIVCLEDGRKFKSLKRHLRTRYNLSPDEYIARWGLPKDYPMVAPNYARARAELAARMGLGLDAEAR